MITDSMIIEIGTILKPHGIKGEMNVVIDVDVAPTEFRCLIIDRDGIFVPFFVADCRRRGADSWLIRFDGVTNETQAAQFNGSTIYVLKSEISEDGSDDEGFYLYDLVDYTLYDEEESLIGEITAVDDSTDNIILTVRTPEGKLIMVPFADELLVDFDTDAHKLFLRLPEGLFNLN